MKRIKQLFIFISFFLILTKSSFAADGINYQAVIRDVDGKILNSVEIGIKVSILNTINSSSPVYAETHQVKTNDFGIINIKIGLGEAITGAFDNINWSIGDYFVEIAVDLNKSGQYTIIGKTQMMSVPYALYAKKSGELNIASLSDEFIADLKEKMNLSNQTPALDLKVTTPGYVPVAETKDFVAYQAKTSYPIEAVLGNISIIKTSTTQFKISQTGINGNHDVVVNLNSTNFPGLITGSTILKIVLLPWDRNAKVPVPSNGWRCCVITDKCQLYHNFPNRTPQTDKAEGLAIDGDINRWDESVVWDLPNRRYPSKTTDNFPYYYNPCLPETCYDLYPKVNTDNGYGHGGFEVTDTRSINGATIKFPRFYFHQRSEGSNPFFYMSGFETSNKVQLIGTYRSNTSGETCSRICVFATTDGGRQWYNKYEFANSHQLAYGNVLVGSNISEEYIPNTLSVQKRKSIYPSASNKNPVDLFSYESEVNVTEIIKSTSSLVLNTSNPHNLTSGDIIVLKDKSANNSTYDFLSNININLKNGGNGRVWKAEVLSPTSIRLYEYVHNPDSNLPVRHIHAINKLKDGFLISTGETYPEGWIMYLQIKNSDSFSFVNAYDLLSFYRLNSSEKSVRRTLGTILYDDADQTIILGSDEANLSTNPISVEGRNDLSFSRSSTGVYKGKLADIDDFSKFACIYESTQVCYFFKEYNGMLIYAGQQGEVAVSVDMGKSWRRFFVGNPQIYSKGVDHIGRFIIDSLILYKKI